MFCSNCGYEVEEGNKFCQNCGNPIIQNTETIEDKHVVNRTVSNTSMSVEATSIIAYMTWIGFLIAYIAGDKEGAKFYLNQALVFNIFAMGIIIPIIGWLWAIFILVCFILGIIWAANQEPRELPLIGSIKILD